jgi:hypothetical protein
MSDEYEKVDETLDKAHRTGRIQVASDQLVK